LLRFDLIAAIDASAPDSNQPNIQIAHLTAGDSTYKLLPQQSLLKWETPLDEFLLSLEKELGESKTKDNSATGSEEKGILISVTQEARKEAEDSIEELKELARTAGVIVLDATIQRPRQFSPKYLMGEGKMRDIVIRALQLGATMLIFDQELSPAQIRSISEMTELKVIDRSQLILDIFARRATTLDGKVQVELAQLKYLLPRLVGKGVQMSRLMGGIGGRGPGETKLEMDRRHIRNRISKLEKELEKLSDGRYQRRQKRATSRIPIISIVGYTNAGKSTLLNTLTKSNIFTENLLFATLDTSSRRLRFPRDKEAIITDTVGFIRSLPESLMGAFKATLEELQDADLLIHLVDCSNYRFMEQIDQVNQILEKLGLADKPQILVFNKSDLLPNIKANSTIDFIRVKQATHRFNAIHISAINRKSLEPLIEQINRQFWPEELTYD